MTITSLIKCIITILNKIPRDKVIDPYYKPWDRYHGRDWMTLQQFRGDFWFWYRVPIIENRKHLQELFFTGVLTAKHITAVITDEYILTTEDDDLWNFRSQQHLLELVLRLPRYSLDTKGQRIERERKMPKPTKQEKERFKKAVQFHVDAGLVTHMTPEQYREFEKARQKEHIRLFHEKRKKEITMRQQYFKFAALMKVMDLGGVGDGDSYQMISGTIIPHLGRFNAFVQASEDYVLYMYSKLKALTPEQAKASADNMPINTKMEYYASYLKMEGKKFETPGAVVS